MARPLRPLEWMLIVALAGSWAVLFARSIGEGLRTGRGFIPIGVSTASAGGYPTVLSSEIEAIQSGDLLIALDREDLRESSALHFYDRATRIARERGAVLLLAERAGAPVEARISLTPRIVWWLRAPVTAAWLVIGLLLLVRAPGWHLARLNFVMSWCTATASAVSDYTEWMRSTAPEVMLSVATLSVAMTLGVWITQGFTAQALPVPRLHRAVAAAAGLLLLAQLLFRLLVPYTSAQGRAIAVSTLMFGFGGVLGGLTRAYRRSSSLERRQIRWVALGCYVTCLGTVVAACLALIPARTAARSVSSLTATGVPVGVLVSVIGYGWLDIDRVISAAASYTIIGIAVLGAALALVPRVATAAAPALGVDPAVAQWLLTMALVLAAVPAYLYVRPRLDRQMFPERHQRMSGLERLLDEVGHCSGAEALWQLTSERLEELLAPESLVVYAREGDVFTGRFTRGGAAPPYAADSLLVRALERRGRPLAADSAEVDPFDRAALETLGVAVVVPIGTQGSLLGFASLGRKRSGDIYTREETAQLAAIASRCALVLRPPAPAPDVSPRLFRYDGELWTISSQGKEIRLRDMRGLRYLALLLREPGREFRAIDLVRAAEGAAPQGPMPDPELRMARGLGDAGPVLDAQARAAYRDRVTELDRELAEAERCADLGRLEQASAEREALLAELESAVRGRPQASDSERARVAVTKAIKVALEKIGERHPDLGAHLAATVRRGYVCAYEPDPPGSADWEM